MQQTFSTVRKKLKLLIFLQGLCQQAGVYRVQKGLRVDAGAPAERREVPGHDAGIDRVEHRGFEPVCELEEVVSPALQR